LESGNVNVVLQVNPKRHPDLPNVPNAIEHAKSDEGRMLLEAAVHSPGAVLRAYALPPGIPKDSGKRLSSFNHNCEDHFMATGLYGLRIDKAPGDAASRILTPSVFST
jgi:hypothetical protein